MIREHTHTHTPVVYWPNSALAGITGVSRAARKASAQWYPLSCTYIRDDSLCRPQATLSQASATNQPNKWVLLGTEEKKKKRRLNSLLNIDNEVMLASRALWREREGQIHLCIYIAGLATPWQVRIATILVLKRTIVVVLQFFFFVSVWKRLTSHNHGNALVFREYLYIIDL